MSRMPSLAALVLGGLALLAGQVAAQGTDELWDVTMSMELAGGGVTVPPMNQRVCTPKGKMDEPAVPIDKNCKVLDSKRSGSRFTFSFKCEGRNNYTGTGEMEYQGKDAYQGKMRATGTMDGQPMDMSATWSGKRAGTCQYEDQRKEVERVQAQGNAQIAQMCDKAVDELATMLIVGDNMPCKDRKADLCTRAAKIGEESRDPAGFRRNAGRDWRGALKACGQDDTAIVRAACGAAAGKRDGEFLRDQCPDEAAAMRKQYCLGRTYTSVDASARELCGALGGLSYTAERASPAAAQPQDGGKSNLTDKLKEGAGKLKKFLKF